jgi:fumarylpyruvate hydrolase
MTRYVFSNPQPPYVEVAGPERLRFPVHRIYCVGRNYAEHAREMGMNPEKEPPFFFTKPADAIVHDGADVPYPPRTSNLHHEIELVVAIGRGGRDVPVATALEHVYGYAVGCDYTRRDLQKAAREAGRPWDTAKGFDRSAAVSAIQPVAAIGHPTRGRIWLTVNGEHRQGADVRDMIWDVPAVIAELSTLWELQPGDLIYTGTPAGVGPVVPGDTVAGGVDGVGTLRNTIYAAR